VEGFNGYIDETVQRLNGGFGIPEVMMGILTFFLFFFDTQMKEKFPYEYHRNYAVIGICFYFIFRNNPIFFFSSGRCVYWIFLYHHSECNV
jgi:transmembrane protein EpsG